MTPPTTQAGVPPVQLKQLSMKRRIRHHVNPLTFREHPEIPDWNEVFAKPEQDLEVDIGSGKGQFLLARAKHQAGINIVGLEIRKPMVERLREIIEKEALTNAFILRCNANLSLIKLFAAESLSRAYVHFPDPWFKKRHHKRRLIKTEFLNDLSVVLKRGGEFHFATDYQEYAEEVLELMEPHGGFGEAQAMDAPFGLESDRETWHRSQGDAVHRYKFACLGAVSAEG